MKKTIRKLLCATLVMIILFSVIPITKADAVDTVQIPSDAVEFNGHWYKVYDISKSWTDAKKYCESLGGHLVTITTQEEQTFIENTFLTNNPNKHFYLAGGYRQKSNSEWIWVTGELFNYNNWGGKNGEEGNQQYNTGQNYIWIGSTKYKGHEKSFVWISHENYDYKNVTWNTNKSGFICEWEDGKTNNGIKIYSTHASNYLSVKDTVNMLVGYYNDGILDEDYNDFIAVISDNNIIDVQSGDWNSQKGRSYYIKAKKQGSATVTFTNPETNESAAFTFYVENPETAYTFYNIPELTYEAGKKTNFYNYGGLVVDEFAYEAHEENGVVDYYTVTMNVYNKCNLYGAVTSYDENGVIYEYDLIERMNDFDDSFVSSLETLWYEFGDLYYLLGNEYYYSGQSVTKENKISIRVPVGGNISISNNISTSTIAFVANTVYAVASMISVANEYLDIFTPDKLTEEAIKTVVSTITGEVIKKEIEKSLKNSVKDTTKNYRLNYNNVNEFIYEISNKTSQFGLNLIESIEKNILSVTGVGEIAESYITAIIPTGTIIKLLYASTNALDYTLFNNEYSLSPNKPTGINIYAPNNKNAYVSSGIQITPNNGNIQSNVANHSYIVEDIDLSQLNNSSWIDTKDYMHYKQKMYNITMYKDGDETQPDSTIEVRIPLPTGYKTIALKVYRYNDDGSITDMNAYTENGYIVFETNHLSCYLILDETAEHNKDILKNEIYATCDSAGKKEYECSFAEK